MKNLLLSTCVLLCASLTHAQLDSVIWEVYYEDDGTIPGYPAGFKTYRIYALVEDADDRVTGVFGGGLYSNDFSIGSSTNKIWNHQGGASILQYFGSDLDESNLANYDSYLTIGKTLENASAFGSNSGSSIPPQFASRSFSVANDSMVSIRKNMSRRNFFSDPIYDVNSLQINANQPGINYSSNSATNTTPQGFDNRVLIAQITTDGVPNYSLNLGIYDAQTNTSITYAFQPAGWWQVDGSTLGLCYPVGNCGSYFGCIDIAACNYDPNSVQDNSMCLYGNNCLGCTNYIASNYNPDKSIDDGSCIYNINIGFFNDFNNDGYVAPGEYLLSDSIPITLLFDGQISTADNLGMALINVPTGVNLLSFDLSQSIWDDVSNGNPFELHLPNIGLSFGMYFSSTPTAIETPYSVRLSFYLGLHASGTFYHVDANVYQPPFLCNSPSIHTHSILNQSNVDVYATTELIIDPLYQNIIDAASADSIVGNHIYYSWDSLAPGQLENELITLLTPLPQYAGQTATIQLHTLVYAMNDSVVIDTTIFSSRLIQCSYDPNTKEANPVGHTENNFILADTPLEYTINFQNTGNAAAQTVLLVDSLDLTKLDIGSFEIISASHSYQQTLLNNGTIQFLFENINLPDSTTNEADSHGHITYRINAKENLNGGDEIHNTAHIYFDNNPAIVTNTTLHTIYDCDNFFAAYTATSGTECTTPTLLLQADNVWATHYTWVVDGIADVDDDNYVVTGSGNHIIELILENPLCGTVSTSDTINSGNPYDLYIASGAYEICEGQSTNLNSSLSTSEYNNWYLDGQWIGSGSPYTATEPGTYQLTSSNGFCIDTAYVDIEVFQMPDVTTITQNINTLSITNNFDWDYQWLLNNIIIDGADNSTYEMTESGIYSVVINNNGCAIILTISAVYDWIIENAANGMMLYPNPTHDNLNIEVHTLSQAMQATIYAADGRIAMQWPISSKLTTLPAGLLSSGVYHIAISNSDGLIAQQNFVVE